MAAWNLSVETWLSEIRYKQQFESDSQMTLLVLSRVIERFVPPIVS